MRMTPRMAICECPRHEIEVFAKLSGIEITDIGDFGRGQTRVVCLTTEMAERMREFCGCLTR